MGKVKTTLDVDEEMKQKAKKHGINMTRLLNDALKEELDLIENNKLLKIDQEIKECYDNIDEYERKLYHLNKIRRREHPQTEAEKIEKIWYKLRVETYKRYDGRDDSYFDQDLIDQSEEILGYGFKELLIIAIWFRKKYRGKQRWDLLIPAYEENTTYTMKNAKYILKKVEHCLPENIRA